MPKRTESTIEIALEDPAGRRSGYKPGDVLISAYEVLLKDGDEIEAIEASVLWATTGKGGEDIGVHLFDRKKSLPQQAYLSKQKLTTVLPSSPLSYAGRIINVEWLVRVKVFLVDGSSFTEDCPFVLGTGCYFEEIDESAESEESSENAGEENAAAENANARANVKSKKAGGDRAN